MPKAKSKTKGAPSPHHYVYPGTQILKNKYGETDLKLFREKCSYDIEEAKKVLWREPLPEFFDSHYLCHIHHQLFKNTFEWAGQIRTVPFTFEDGTTAAMPEMKRAEWGNAFAKDSEILEKLKTLDQTLTEKNNLRGLTRKEFTAEAVELFISLKRIHPFIDGNEQVTEFFFERLARAAGGHQLCFSHVPTERMMAACSEAIQHGNPEPMQHIFEDISNPQKIFLLKEFVYNMKRLGHDVNDRPFMVAKEGVTYLGTYKDTYFEGFVIDAHGTYIIGNKEHLLPEQIKTLKPGDIITFTAPKTTELANTLIPKETLAPLTESEFAERVVNSARVQTARSQVQHLSKIIYGSSNALEKQMGEIFKNPDSGQQIADMIKEFPDSISTLAGIDFICFKNQRRTNAERHVHLLCSAVTSYADSIVYMRHAITQEHHIEQERRGKAVERPSRDLHNLLCLSAEKQREVLSQSPQLYKELQTFVRNLEFRLSASEHRAIKRNDYEKLAESIGVSEQRAQEIVQTVNKVKQAHDNFHTRGQNRSNTLAMAS